MKTLTAFATAYKSLLFGSGLLLVALAGLSCALGHTNAADKAGKLSKEVTAIESKIHPGEVSLFEELAGKLFPVLKNLNKM